MADIAPANDPGMVIEIDDEQGAQAATAPEAADPSVVEIPDEEAEDDGIPARAKRNADGSITLPLLKPVTLRFRKAGTDQVREETFAELTMHRLTGADLRAVGAVKRDQQIVGAARSARIPEPKFNAVFDRMDGEDAGAVISVFGYFLVGGQKTGR